MVTRWERIWDAGGGTSVSVETTRTRNMQRDAGLVLLLALIDRFGPRTRAAYVGVMHEGWRPIGLCALVGGQLREWWARAAAR